MQPQTTAKEARYLRWIAILNLSKGILLCLLAIGLLGFLHRDLDKLVRHWVFVLGFNMEGRHIVRFLANVDKVTDQQLVKSIGIIFALSGVFIAEGIGLLLRQQWAQYLTISFTTSFIPIEIYETHRHFTWMKLGVLLVNAAIVAFLALLLVHEKKRAQQLASVAAIAAPAAAPAAPPNQPSQPSVGCQSA